MNNSLDFYREGVKKKCAHVGSTLNNSDHPVAVTASKELAVRWIPIGDLKEVPVVENEKALQELIEKWEKIH